MRFSTVLLLVLSALTAASTQAQQAASALRETSSSAAIEPGLTRTLAMQRVEAAQKQIKAPLTSIQPFNELAAAYVIRARETWDGGYYKEAENALTEGFHLDANDFQLRKTRVSVLLGEQRYGEAKELATALNRQMPDDVAVYGYLAEADIALGDYDDAVKSAQWMLNMLPNNIPGLLIGAQLRVVYGDSNGALEFLRQAASEISPEDVEEQARIANRIAEIQIETGKGASAEQTLLGVQQLFPEYPATLMNLARVRFSQQRYADAAALLAKIAHEHSQAAALFELARAQMLASRSHEAQSAMQWLEDESKESGQYDDSKLYLARLYEETPGKAAEALRLSQQLVSNRHDVWTLDAYAWALYENGRFSEADTAIQKALAVGIQSAQIFDHAAHISQKLNHEAEAAKYFELSLRTNPESPYATDARSMGGHAVLAATQHAGMRDPDFTPQTASVATERVASSSHDTATLVSPEPAHRAELAVFAPVPVELLSPQPTESSRMISTAQKAVAADPKSAPALAALGAAYLQRARETADTSDFEQAEKALTASLEIDSTGFAAAGAFETMAAVCMGEHRFDDALAYAQKALSLGSGDVSPFAIVGDAHADMGDYDRAAQGYERLTPPEMTLSPRAAYARDSRLSYLKFIMGDMPGAISLMQASVAEGTASQIPSENLAWLHYELGEYYTQAGDIGAADAAYLDALSIHPGDYRALAGLAKLRANHGRYEEAVVLYQKAIAVVPMPTFIAELGDVYAHSGKTSEAAKQYQLVEYIGRLGRINQVLHNRDLALFYADHDMKITEALELARKEFEVRHDIYTWDALAWVLYKNGKYEEAQKASQNALKFGTRDALLLYHSGVIAAEIGQHEQAREKLQEALNINPHFHLTYADAARTKLATMTAENSSKASSDDHAR